MSIDVSQASDQMNRWLAEQPCPCVMDFEIASENSHKIQLKSLDKLANI